MVPGLTGQFETVVKEEDLVSRLGGVAVDVLSTPRLIQLLEAAAIDAIQDFTPTPMTASTTMYYTGLNPFTMQPLHIPRGREKKGKSHGRVRPKYWTDFLKKNLGFVKNKRLGPLCRPETLNRPAGEKTEERKRTLPGFAGDF
jgi:radical SAM superfamily enzyme YgiQ (UPF0313 family)